MQKCDRYSQGDPTDLLWSKKKRDVTDRGIQLTSFDPKNVTSPTGGSNWPFRCLDMGADENIWGGIGDGKCTEGMEWQWNIWWSRKCSALLCQYLGAKRHLHPQRYLIPWGSIKSWNFVYSKTLEAWKVNCGKNVFGDIALKEISTFLRKWETILIIPFHSSNWYML